MDELNKRLGLSQAENDINYVYSFQDNKTSRFHFKTEVRLISGLSDSNKETERDYLINSKNWYPDGIHCTTTKGRASG